MATLIGRMAWHVGGVLSHGKIVKHNLEANAVVIERGIGSGPITIHSSQVLLTINDAILAAEESVDYWELRVKELQNLKAAMEDQEGTT